MIISFNTIPEKSGNNNWLFLIVIAVIALVTLTKAARNFGRELSFYREHSLDDDSGVQTQMKSFSRLSGRNRMFLYYPFVFFAASFAISFVVLILRSN